MTTASAPDGTAVRVALWRALHVEVDPPPHVLDDTVGLRLADPDPDWRARGDMDPDGTRAFRASIVARARFLDDLVRELAAGGVGQYVILGAGLDSFAQRHSDSALQIYEVDQPGTQEWKRRRLTEEGYPLPESLHFVPVDFERGQSWPEALAANGFDASRAAVVSSTGVSMYLTREATEATLRQVAGLAPGSVLAMTFMLPLDLVDAAERPMQEYVEQQAADLRDAVHQPLLPRRDGRHVSRRRLLVGAPRQPGRPGRPLLRGTHRRVRPPTAEHLVVATV